MQLGESPTCADNLLLFSLACVPRCAGQEADGSMQFLPLCMAMDPDLAYAYNANQQQQQQEQQQHNHDHNHNHLVPLNFSGSRFSFSSAPSRPSAQDAVMPCPFTMDNDGPRGSEDGHNALSHQHSFPNLSQQHSQQHSSGAEW